MTIHLGIFTLITVLLAGSLGLMPAHAARADTSLVVTTLADNGSGSLRDAINTANATAGPATITFSVSGTIALTSTLPAIDNDITIDGTGQPITVSGNYAVQATVVPVSATLHLQSITIANVNGGIENAGTLVVTNSTFSGNDSDEGGGIYNSGTLVVTNSTFTGNYAYPGGGGIYNAGIATVINSTFTNNNAGVFAGSIYNHYNGAALTVINSTFLSNLSYRNGGDIANDGTFTMTNSIMVDGSGCIGNATGNHNLIKSFGVNADNTCGMANGVNGNIIGVDPLLGPLADNGGSTLTFLPQPGSPTINAGDNAACPAYDQRGVARPQGAICDIGSVESLIWPRALLIDVMR